MALPYYELSGGIRPDGSYQSVAYPVIKNGAEFHCYDAPHNLAPALISWEKVSGEVVTYEGKKNINYWKRLPEYTYIYNPNETKK